MISSESWERLRKCLARINDHMRTGTLLIKAALHKGAFDDFVNKLAGVDEGSRGKG